MADYMADANWGVMAQQQNFAQIATNEQDAVKAKKNRKKKVVRKELTG